MSDLLKANGFSFSPKFAGCFQKVEGDWTYTVFEPRDTRSGKYELMCVLVRDSLYKEITYPPTTERGILKQLKQVPK